MYINKVYKTCYCRIGPYCIGIMLAYFLKQVSQATNGHSGFASKIKSSITIQRTLGALCVLVSLVLVTVVTMLTYPWLQNGSYQNAWSILYGALHRSVWASAFALLIFGCVNGWVPLINSFLSAGLFQFLSKLTYQCYLLHSVLISAMVSSVRNKIYFSDSTMVSGQCFACSCLLI